MRAQLSRFCVFVCFFVVPTGGNQFVWRRSEGLSLCVDQVFLRLIGVLCVHSCVLGLVGGSLLVVV